jgi:hypothetical protein
MSKVAYTGTVVLLAHVLLTQGCGSNDSSTTGLGTGGVVTSTGGSGLAAGTGGSTTPATGAGGATGGGTGTFTPLCADLTTAAGAAPTKNGICTAADPQLCYKTCGPQSIGFKSETCTAGVYVEQSGCSFPSDGDYSCYKIPATVDAACPATTPQASQVCTVNTCVLCNVDGNYLDSSGAPKVGYCVCPPPSAVTGVAKWSCASSTAWPCPAGQGC